MHTPGPRDGAVDPRNDNFLRADAGLFEAVFDAASDAILIADDQGRYLAANRAAGELLGLASEQIVGRSVGDFTAPGRDYVEGWRAFLALGHSRGEHELTHRDGTVRYVEYNAVAHVRPGLHVSILRDVTDRKRAEAALRTMEGRLRGLFESNIVNITFGTSDGAIIDANDAFLETVGRSRADLDAGLLTWSSLTPPEFMDVNLRAEDELQRTGKAAPFEKQYLRPDGRRPWVLLWLARLPGIDDGTVALSIDISRQKEVEDQLRQAQKMEAIGRLAGGIAHDFNNLLTAIIGYAELVHHDAALTPSVREDVGEILKAAGSAAGLTRQLLAFSRRQLMQPRILSLNDTVQHIQAILRRLLGEDIVLTAATEPLLALVSADPVQIEQVVMNLALNARDAMPSGGRLRIETANVVLDASYVTAHQGAVPGPHVMLAVSDTGVGMEESVKSRLFEPFFTTKEHGKGTGLGLATVYGAIRQMGGSIAVDSVVGRGTTFRIYLPAAEGQKSETLRDVSGGTPDRGHEAILLVEDQTEVRRVAAQILTRHGYRVVEAPGPREALRLAGTAPFDLLLTDVVMPDMSGRELARRLHALRPDLRVLYTSGCTDNAIGHHGVLESGLAFAQKPFTPASLLQKVRAALDAPEPTSL